MKGYDGEDHLRAWKVVARAIVIALAAIGLAHLVDFPLSPSTGVGIGVMVAGIPYVNALRRESRDRSKKDQ